MMKKYIILLDVIRANVVKVIKFHSMLLFAFLLSSGVSLAQEDNIEPYALTSLVYDSNFFRLEGDQEAQRQLGTTDMDVFYTKLGAGVNINKALSQQKVSMAAEVTRTDFSRFGFVDNTGGNGDLKWDWLIGKQWSGIIQYSYDRSLASYAEDQLALKDMIENKEAFASGRFQLNPEWAFSANIKGTDRTHDADLRKLLDRNSTSYQLGMHYSTSLDSIFNVYFRHSTVDFPERILSSTSLLDNGYSDQWLGVSTEINVSGHSRTEAKIEYLHRNHDHITDRDYSGMQWSLTYDWLVTGKLELEASIWRGIDQVEDVYANRVNETGLEFKPIWSMSEKMKVSGDIASSHRDYVYYAGLVNARTDDLIIIGAQFEYTPLEQLQCIFRLENGDRNSNYDIYNFTYDTLSAYVQYTF